MRRIIAVGGGSLDLTQTINEEFLRLAAIPNPRLLFIPTASDDSPEYILGFSAFFSAWGASVDVLRLSANDDISKIDAADLIYVGGGNTKAMLARWRETGVEEKLREHVAAGKPVSGTSAGAICWFRVGNSDWPQYEKIPGVNTARLDCLGIVDMVACPHTRDEPFRLREFMAMMERETGAGIGLDDGVAIQIDGDAYRILAVSPERCAFHVKYDGDSLRVRRLFGHDDFRPLEDLG